MTQQNSNIQPNPSNDDEIDLIALAKTLWNGRKTVIKTTLIFMAIGLFVAIFSEKEYTASTTFVPQTSGSKGLGGNLGGLAAMAGINLGGMSGDAGIAPELYPQIINSVPFQKELLQTPLTIDGQKEKVSFENYYNEIYRPSVVGYLKKFTIGLPGLLIKIIKGDKGGESLKSQKKSILRVSKEEQRLIKQLSDQVSLEVNEKEGYVTVSARMTEALASAQLTLKVQELLQEYVINFKIRKSKEQLKFIKSRFLEIEEKFEFVQQKLANRKDRNQNISSARAITNNQKLEDEYNLIYGVYSELAKQLEAQYIQVTEDTPVFTVLRPVSVPIEKSKPMRFLILFLWSTVGLLLGIGLVFCIEYYKGFTKKYF